ncbi:MAG: hypothetical protein CMP76_17105 [Flavobacterium sp.]|uniref:hypothetical protein n=1 Tax=Flavobacterium sp. TaxID=239 RepID=UPI000C57D99B|nr:hypothetical protein [Flavobacterium sp.]MBF04997.1 hypothetical protein [Flavobacterium sp.]|tara:strand:+ start:3185 stop:3604 length:420 start_codon:yes stop_codon:yes gene_type:complete
MEKQILQNVSPEERLITLKNNSFSVEKFSYPRELELSEVQELQSELSQQMIAIDKEDQKLKMAKEIYKAAVKPVKQEMAANLNMIRTQIEEVTDEVYLMKDLEENKMGYYSKEGKLVFERALKSEEMQFSITDHLRKAE